jgi:hypothetical protein
VGQGGLGGMGSGCQCPSPPPILVTSGHPIRRTDAPRFNPAKTRRTEGRECPIWIEMPARGAQREVHSYEIPQRVADSPMLERDAISRCLSEVQVCTMPHRSLLGHKARQRGCGEGGEGRGGTRGIAWDGEWLPMPYLPFYFTTSYQVPNGCEAVTLVG